MAIATNIAEKQAGYADSIFNPASSFFVSANAGSGKTSQLTRRVLGLLLCGIPPGRILCLTFTNAAAAEMKQRVLAELGTWVMSEEAVLQESLQKLLGTAPDHSMLARARALFAEVLEAPEGVRIQTIHGFCQSLLARFPIEAGISPHFSVMDSRTSSDLLAEARLRLFTSRQHSPDMEEAIRTLARIVNTEDFTALLDDIVKNKFKFQSLLRLPGGVDAAIEAMWESLKVQQGTTLDSLVEKYFSYDEKTLATLRRLSGELLAGGKTDNKTGAAITKWLAGERDIETYVRTFLSAEYNKLGTGKVFTKATIKDSNDSEALNTEQERVAQFHQARMSLQMATLSAAVLRLAEALLKHYDEIKQQHARMDYDDLILTARDLLMRPGISPWVLYKLDGGIDHVLIDEAQDTSPQQWQIVKALTEDFFSGLSRSEADRSLFIVGDEKQSIFSFQGADVRQLAAVYETFRARIEAIGQQFHLTPLTRSYRSVPQVLQAVDAVFATAHTAHRAHENGLVEIWPLVTAENPQSQLARQLAAAIRGWIDEGRWGAGDIMILVRTRSAFVDHMVRALKRKGVAVAGVDRMVLGENLAVQDLIALGKTLLLPEDDLTLAALLKSPMFGMSEETLFELCWNRDKKPLWDKLSQYTPDGYRVLSDLRDKADYVLPYELYAYALDTLGLRKKILGRMGEEYADAIDEFMAQTLVYQQDNTPSLQGFLHWLESGDSEIKRDMEQAHNAVRIMTVHGAKGLQAPVVILPDTLSKPKFDEHLLWHDDGVELPLWVKSSKADNAASRAVRDAKKAAALEEYRRLLYVALTRAEDALYICGASGKDEANDESWYGLVHQALWLLGEACETPAGEGRRFGHPGDRVRRSHLAKVEGRDDKDFAFLTQPAPLETNPPKPLAPSHVGEEPPAASPLKQNVYQRGLFIHSVLQHLPSVAETKRAAVAQSLSTSYRGQMKDDEIKQCIDEAIHVMAQFSEVFSGNSLAEVPVAGTITVKGEPFVVSGQIDLLTIFGNDIWIVDYKTNRLPPQSAANTPEAYLRQMAVYKALLAKIYPGRAIHCALLWTSVPRMDVLDEAVLGSYI